MIERWWRLPCGIVLPAWERNAAGVYLRCLYPYEQPTWLFGEPPWYLLAILEAL